MKKAAGIVTLCAVFTMAAMPLASMAASPWGSKGAVVSASDVLPHGSMDLFGKGKGHGHGPGDGTGTGTGPADGTGYGPGSCTP